MKKTIITSIVALCVVLLTATLVANCTYSNNNSGTPAAKQAPPPADSIDTPKPKIAHLGLIPFEQWKDETKYILSMLDDTTGLSTNNQFMLVKEMDDKETGILLKSYTQVYKDIEVLGGTVGLWFKEDTLYRKMERPYKVSLDANPSISEAEALAKIQADQTSPVHNKTPIAQKGLLIMPMYGIDGKDMRLCWTFIFEKYRVFIDAHNGETVNNSCTEHNYDVPATVTTPTK